MISAFASSIGISVGSTSCTIGLKLHAITAGIKKYRLIIKKKTKKHDKKVLLGKTKSNAMKVLIPKALINPYINDDDFVSVNNMMREYNKTKEEIETPKLCGIYYINMIYIRRKAYERNDIEAIVHNTY